MSRRTIIILAIALVALIAAVSIVVYFLSFRTVTFDIVPENIAITVRDQDNQEKGSLSADGSLRLQNGTYAAVPTGEIFATTPIEFSVNSQNITVTIDPDYSVAHLEELRKAEQAAITKVIRDTYASVIGNFTIPSGTLYKKGEWYGGLLIQNPLGGGQLGDVYRVVLKKENNIWTVVATPSIVLSTEDHPNIPYDILTTINAKERP